MPRQDAAHHGVARPFESGLANANTVPDGFVVAQDEIGVMTVRIDENGSWFHAGSIHDALTPEAAFHFFIRHGG